MKIILFAVLMGQTARLCQGQADGTTSPPGVRGGRPAAAYCIETETHFERRGSAGFVIKTEREARQCVDGRGRERTDTTNLPTETLVGEGDAKGEKIASVMILDRVAGTILSWSVGSGDDHHVFLQHVKPSPAAQEPMPLPQTAQTWGDPSGRSGKPYTVCQPLGRRTIGGVLAEGVSYEAHIPIGYQGSSEAYTSTSEIWASVDFHVMLEQTLDDPAGEKQVVLLKSFTPGEPAADIFVAPASYVVTEL